MNFVFDSVERFIAGTVGEPGDRAFFIQARNSSRLITVALEKSQVSVLADRLEILINDLRKADFSLIIETKARDDATLEPPIDAQFEVGAISINWDEVRRLINIELFEIQSDESSEASSLKVCLDLGMCQAFIARSRALVRAGRLPCPFCGLPIDPQGHLCPRANGYRR